MITINKYGITIDNLSNLDLYEFLNVLLVVMSVEAVLPRLFSWTGLQPCPEIRLLTDTLSLLYRIGSFFKLLN